MARSAAANPRRGMVATGKPGTLQIRLAIGRAGFTRWDGRLHRRFRRAGVRGQASRSCDHRRHQLVDRTERIGRVGGITGVTPLTLYRDWILQTAWQWGRVCNPFGAVGWAKPPLRRAPMLV